MFLFTWPKLFASLFVAALILWRTTKQPWDIMQRVGSALIILSLVCLVDKVFIWGAIAGAAIIVGGWVVQYIKNPEEL